MSSKYPRHLKQSTYKRNGKSMTQMEVQENGSTIVYDREIKGDDMHVVYAKLFNNYALILIKFLKLLSYLQQKITYGNLVANRVFKRL